MKKSKPNMGEIDVKKQTLTRNRREKAWFGGKKKAKEKPS
jgi:hypothetical protein